MCPLPIAGEGVMAFQRIPLGEGEAESQPPHPSVFAETNELPSPAVGRGHSNERRVRSAQENYFAAGYSLHERMRSPSVSKHSSRVIGPRPMTLASRYSAMTSMSRRGSVVEGGSGGVRLPSSASVMP